MIIDNLLIAKSAHVICIQRVIIFELHKARISQRDRVHEYKID